MHAGIEFEWTSCGGIFAPTAIEDVRSELRWAYLDNETNSIGNARGINLYRGQGGKCGRKRQRLAQTPSGAVTSSARWPRPPPVFWTNCALFGHDRGGVAKPTFVDVVLAFMNEFSMYHEILISTETRLIGVLRVFLRGAEARN